MIGSATTIGGVSLMAGLKSRHRGLAWAALLASLLFSCLLMECSPWVVYPILKGETFPRSEIRQRLLGGRPSFEPNLRPATRGISDHMKDAVLHPYLGFVLDSPEDYNQYGFYSESPVRDKAPDEIHVGIFGGSVAGETFVSALEILPGELGRLPIFRDKKIHLFCFADGGIKQPQQLMTLTYFSVLGVDFDIVINLDGYNEVVLPYGENIPANVNPIFPRMWHLLSTSGLDRSASLEIGRIDWLRERRDRWRARFASFPLQYSNFMLALWDLLDYRLGRSILRATATLNDVLSSADPSFQTTGPPFQYESSAEIFQDLAETWKRSSLLMARLSEANGASYFHFLQPNQYFPGSKKLTRKERRRAYYQGRSPATEAVRRGYPLLVEKGKELRRLGVDFHDLTMLYKDQTETLYVDFCCHVNRRGYDLIAREISETLSRTFRARNLRGLGDGVGADPRERRESLH